MPLFPWDDSYSVGVRVIDDQHRKLVSLLNDLHDAMRVGKARSILGRIFEDLVAYTKYHFSTEERLMEQHGYDGYAAHKAEHDDLTAKALDLQQRWRAGTLGISIETSEFLRAWLAHHIQGTDKQLGAFLNTKGVS